MMKKEKFYITTPIYYPSGKWHLGTCYTTVVCDAIARYNRLAGKDVFYLTGTDEHGQKLEKVAENAGVPVKEYIDANVQDLKKLWEVLEISYDKFIRTTDKEHKDAVQKIFQQLYDKGDIYKSIYEGWYCRPCEAFWTDTQLKDGKCPDCGREVTKMKEESYFFRLSKYQDRIIKLFEENENFLLPKSRKNEMYMNFLKPGLQDLSVSRNSFKWGIEVPFDKEHIIYVWIDALTNYITALGYASHDDSLFKKYWPADVHMMAKEIIRFHSIIWPAILMALDIGLPKQIFGHGWLLFGEDKISKSKLASIVPPTALVERYGVDAVRYYLLSAIPFGQDGSYTNSAFLYKINADLANTLGNLVSRSTAMCEQYFGGKIPKFNLLNEDEEICKEALNLHDIVKENVDKYMIPEAIQAIMNLLVSANKYIDQNTPWVLAKDESKKERLSTVIYVLLETIRFAAVELQAFLVKTPDKIFESLGIKENIELRNFGSLKDFGGLKEGTSVKKGEPLFARIDVKKELEELERIAIESTKVEKDMKNENVVKIEEITIDEFDKIKLVSGTICEAEAVAKSNKLLKFKVDLGSETRTIVSGIAKYYKPEEMVGKTVIIVSNLKPTKLCGIESQGMILCASKGDQLSVITVDDKIGAGAEIN